MAAEHALPRHRPPLGPSLAEHADLRYGGRLSGPGAAGRDERVGGARDDASVRDLRRAVDRPREDPPTLRAPPAARARSARPRLRADVPQVGRPALPRLPDSRDRRGRLPSLPDHPCAPAGHHRRAPGPLRLERAALRVRHRPAADRRAARRPRRARRSGARRRLDGPRALVAWRDRGVPQGGAVRAPLPLSVGRARARPLSPRTRALAGAPRTPAAPARPAPPAPRPATRTGDARAAPRGRRLPTGPRAPPDRGRDRRAGSARASGPRSASCPASAPTRSPRRGRPGGVPRASWRRPGGRRRRRARRAPGGPQRRAGDRKSTRLNSSHITISYAVF